MNILEVALPTRPVVPENKMRPAHSQPGAIEILISLFCRGFREMGHTCDVYTVGRSPLNNNPFFTCANAGFGVPVGDWSNFNNCLIDLIQLSPVHYDVIHIHAYATATSPRWREIKQPVVYTWHDPPTLTVQKTREYQIEQLMKISKHNGIKPVAISRTQRDRGGYDIPFIHNGLDIDQYNHKRKRTDRFFSIGRIVPDKGFDIAVDACYRTGAKLDIVGNLYHGTFFRHAIEPKTGNGIKYHGALYGNRKKRFFETCKALLNPIRWAEPFGLTLVEALASGAPVVGFDKGAVREVVGECGILEDNAPALRKRVADMPKINPEKCRRRAEKFSYKKMVKSYLKYFGEL